MTRLLNQHNPFARHRKERIGLFLGTSTAGVENTLEPVRAWKASGDESVLSYFNESHQHVLVEDHLRETFDLYGPGCTFATACSSAALAISEAMEAIKDGVVDAAIAGGFDVLNIMTLLGFDSLQILNPEPCVPFHGGGGITLGEGGALILLEREEGPDHSSAPPLAYLLGHGSSSDAFHITRPHPEGEGMILAMQQAIAMAGIPLENIQYINAHGTGTAHNDAAEARAIGKVFGTQVTVSSTKGLHGHLLGASGAIESVVCILALQEGICWSGAHTDLEPDPVPFTYGSSQRMALQAVLSNSFGFGGSNVSLVFGAAGERS